MTFVTCDHAGTGHTNSFHIQTQTPLAQRYNDMSVMENHHTALTFAILAKRDCAILSHLDKPMRQVRSSQSHPSCTPVTADLEKLQDPVHCSHYE